MPFDQQQFEVEAPQIRNDPVLQWLIESRARIATPDKWCKGALYRDGARCIVGAFNNTSENLDNGRPDDVIDGWCLLNNALPLPVSIPFFNNMMATTHADVLALFDRAIAARKTELAK